MKLYLAPMHGTTKAFYRCLYNELFGNIDTYYAPFIGTSLMRKSYSSVFDDILPENNKGIHLVPQLLGNNAEDFKFFAESIAKMGYETINWNIGCPYEKVTRKKKGSGLLAHPNFVKEFLDEVCKETNYNLTVKMRLGLTHVDEGARIIEILNDYPIKEVIIHARTGSQKYGGQVNLDEFETLYTASKHPVSYNGDIYTKDDFMRIQNRFPDIHNFMIGRGSLRNPFLASNIKGVVISNEEKIQLIKKFHDSVYDFYKSTLSSELKMINQMKEFWMYIAEHIDPKGEELLKIQRCLTEENYLKVIHKLFESITNWDDIV